MAEARRGRDRPTHADDRIELAAATSPATDQPASPAIFASDRVELIEADPQLTDRRVWCQPGLADQYARQPAPEPGARGRVATVDGRGTVYVDWDGGTSTAMLPDRDQLLVLTGPGTPRPSRAEVLVGDTPFVGDLRLDIDAHDLVVSGDVRLATENGYVGFLPRHRWREDVAHGLAALDDRVTVIHNRVGYHLYADWQHDRNRRLQTLLERLRGLFDPPGHLDLPGADTELPGG